MQLESLNFCVFVLVFTVLYFALSKKNKAQMSLLTLASYILIYSVGGLESVIVITVVSAAAFFCGIILENALNRKKKTLSKWCCAVGITGVLGIWLVFKFSSCIADFIQKVSAADATALWSLAVPLGISYYSLTLIAYVIDVFHRKHGAEHNFLEFLAMVTYFPCILEGPINLYKKVSGEFKKSHYPDAGRITRGLQRCLWGYFKKVVIADRIGILVSDILGDEGAYGWLIIVAMLLYSFQIYADFSGGIDVVMGITEILDIKVTENFKAPLLSGSVTEFWGRWHMSLGEFMEKYIYYPIVLNRRVMKFSKKIPSKYLQKVFSATLASIIVFIVVGIWHGTGWNYVAYGCYQAFFVSTAVLLGPVYKKMRAVCRINEHGAGWKIITAIRTFLILTVGRYFIKAGNLAQAGLLMKKSLDLSNFHVIYDGTLLEHGLDYKNIYIMLAGIVILIAVDIMHGKGLELREILCRQDVFVRYLVYTAALFCIIMLGIYGLEFNSVSFIYQSF